MPEDRRHAAIMRALHSFSEGGLAPPWPVPSQVGINVWLKGLWCYRPWNKQADLPSEAQAEKGSPI